MSETELITLGILTVVLGVPLFFLGRAIDRANPMHENMRAVNRMIAECDARSKEIDEKLKKLKENCSS